ncbi:glycosyltransferase [uncultured Desulfosarcina sp.]|uniref:glycosyltransferase n=1 Tax=uncultured Desulfosarcina sp. TaxID=218289 RepID=UPI0029C6238E|nr:glycosyltransferase [uncultured Desulfosarcina sp.]
MREAKAIISSGEPEPYFGMGYTLSVLDKFFGQNERLVISLNAPAYDIKNGRERLLSIPLPNLPTFVPGRLISDIRTAQIIRVIKKFRPTHLLVRSGGRIAYRILSGLKHYHLNTLVVCANVFQSKSKAEKKFHSLLINELNENHVRLVGNHRWPATQSMIDVGLAPKKAVAWDWPGQKKAEDFPVRYFPENNRFEILYVGAIIKEKGVDDLIEAIEIIRKTDQRFMLKIIGDGADFHKHMANFRDSHSIAFLGRLSNDQVFEQMCKTTLIVVPSRHSFSEGFPLTLTEALASRTPVIVSDHPVMLRSLIDREGVRFFRAADPSHLAQVIKEVMANPGHYNLLSETTANALSRVECKYYFGDLLNAWKASFDYEPKVS